MKKTAIILLVIIFYSCGSGETKPIQSSRPDTLATLAKFFITENSWREDYLDRIIKDSVKGIVDSANGKFEKKVVRDTTYYFTYADTVRVNGKPSLDSSGKVKLGLRTVPVPNKWIIIDYNIDLRKLFFENKK